MFPVSEDNFYSQKFDFGVTVAITQQQRLCRILVQVDLVVEGGVQLQCYDAEDRGGREQWRRKS